MSTFGKIFTTILILALVGGGVWWFTLRESDGTDGSNNTQSTQTQSGDENSEIALTITYTDNGFEPASYEMRSGGTVRVINNSGDHLQFSSDPHPNHTENPELNAGQTLDTGESLTLVLNEVGNWGFHNHHNDAHGGTITVTD